MCIRDRGISIRLAGFERFDTCAWIHAQGFPKSLSVGGAIDKEAGAEREVIGQRKGQGSIPNDRGKWGLKPNTPVDITVPATDAAKIWEGYGTSLKPSIEFVLCFRKPRNATYAKTAMEHGTAALNIDGCRIPSAKPYTINTWDDGAKPFGDGAGHPFTGRQQSGRWPANLILSHSSECGDEGCAEGCPVAMLDKQSGECGNKWKKNYGKKYAEQELQYAGGTFGGGGYLEKSTYSDKGGASRYFQCFDGERFCYVSKANKKERNMRLPKGERNPHTTVKPLALCRYLAHLIVPPEEYRDEAELLVPFSGVKSEVLGAFLAGWRNITAIELEEDYCEIGQKRVDWWLSKIKETGLTDPKAILKACRKEDI